MNTQLPAGWATTGLGNIFEFKYGKGLPEDKRHSGGTVRVYGSNGVVGMHDWAITKGPTIIVGRKGSVGEVNFSRDPVWPIDTTYYIDEFPADSPPNYWTLCLKSLRLGQQEKSSAIPGISRDDIYEVEVPIPPLNEQRRIVVKLEKVLAKVDTCQKRLEKIPVILKRFRQSVLAAACSGRLTADRYNEPINNGELPTGWKWTRVNDLVPTGGLFDGPFGSSLKTSDYATSGVRVIRLENIGRLTFVQEKESYITAAKHETLKRHTVGQGDIVVASFIDEEVRVCVLPRLSTPAIAKADCFCVRPRPDLVETGYLTYQLASGESYNKLSEEIHGATRPRINTTQLRRLEVRICPLPEQHEIVCRVEALFALANQIETRYRKAKAYVDKLSQSILAKAFRGELVSQDPNDEPASKLLERIRSETIDKRPQSRNKKRA